MSSSLAELVPVRRLRQARPPRLRLLADPTAAATGRKRAIGRGAFVAVVGALVLVGMALLLILNTTLAQGAFDLQQLRAEYEDLQVHEQSLAQQVATAQSPEALKAEAVRLGMVPVKVPAFLRLADGAVLGEPTPAKARHAQRAKLARGAAIGTGDGASLDSASSASSAGGTSATDAASPAGTGRAAVAPPQSDGAEAAEAAAARDGSSHQRRVQPAGDGAVDGPEGAEDQAAPTGPGTARG